MGGCLHRVVFYRISNHASCVRESRYEYKEEGRGPRVVQREWGTEKHVSLSRVALRFMIPAKHIFIS